MFERIRSIFSFGTPTPPDPADLSHSVNRAVNGQGTKQHQGQEPNGQDEQNGGDVVITIEDGTGDRPTLKEKREAERERYKHRFSRKKIKKNPNYIKQFQYSPQGHQNKDKKKNTQQVNQNQHKQPNQKKTSTKPTKSLLDTNPTQTMDENTPLIPHKPNNGDSDYHNGGHGDDYGNRFPVFFNSKRNRNHFKRTSHLSQEEVYQAHADWPDPTSLESRTNNGHGNGFQINTNGEDERPLSHITDSEGGEEENGEETIVLTEEQQSMFLNMLQTLLEGMKIGSLGIQKILEAVKNTIKDPYSYPALVTAIIPALNAYAYPSGKDSKHIGETWGTMSEYERFQSIFFFIASFTVNFLMNKYYYPKAWKQLKELLKDIKGIKEDPKQFALAVALFLAGFSAAFTSASIAYDTSLGLPGKELTAALLSISAFLPYFAVRFVSANNTVTDLRNALNKDLDVLRDFADVLERLNMEKYEIQIYDAFDKAIDEWCACKSSILLASGEYLVTEIEQAEGSSEDKPLLPRLADIEEKLHQAPLASEDYADICARFADKLALLIKDYPDIVNKKTNWYTFKKIAGTTFDYTFATGVIAIWMYLSFMQKTFDGIKTVGKFAGEDLSDWPLWGMLLSSLYPGGASVVAFHNAGRLLRYTGMRIAQALFPKDIVPASLVLTFVILSAYGPAGVAVSFLRENNMFDLHFHEHAQDGTPHAAINITALCCLAAHFIGGAVINFSALVQAFLREWDTVSLLSINDVIHQLHTNPHKLAHQAKLAQPNQEAAPQEKKITLRTKLLTFFNTVVPPKPNKKYEGGDFSFRLTR